MHIFIVPDSVGGYSLFVSFVCLFIIFLPRLMKLCVLVGYKFLIKKLNFWGQSVHFRSCDITKHGIYKIGHISAIFKDNVFWFGPKISIKLCAEHWSALGVIKCISGHVTAH